MSLCFVAGEKRAAADAVGHTCGVRVQKERFLRWTGLAAGGFLGLTGPLAPRVVVAASPQIKKRGAAGAAGCIEGL